MKTTILSYCLTLIISLIVSNTYSQTTYPVIWERLTGSSIQLGNLVKVGLGTGTASSTYLLNGKNSNNNVSDGFFTYTANSLLENKKLGFGYVELPETDPNLIVYGFEFGILGQIKVFAPNQVVSFPASVGAQVKLQRSHDTIKYYINNSIVFQTKSVITDYLVIRAELTSISATFSNVQASFNTTRLVFNPLFNHTTNTVDINPSGGTPSYTYQWEDNIKTKSTKKFIDGMYPVIIKDALDNSVERLFSVGTDVVWGNFSNASQTGATLQKSGGLLAAWGTAKSTVNFNKTDDFWVEYIIEDQNDSKVVGLTSTTAALSSFSGIKAGFLVANNHQTQIIYNGSVVKTLEFYDKDALNIHLKDNELTWMVNGKKVYTASASILDATFKIGGLVKTATTLVGVHYYANSPNPLTSTWNSATETGSITIDISNVPSVSGPYHYLISEAPIPTLYESYTYMKNSIYNGVLDSVTYFTGKFTGTSHTFSDLGPGIHYTTVFNSLGQQIIGKTTLVQAPIVFDTQSGLSVTGTRIKGISGTPIGNVAMYAPSNTRNEMKVVFEDVVGEQFVGYTDPGKTLTSYSDLIYGVYLNENKLWLVKNGQLSSNFTMVRKNATINFELKDQVFSARIAGGAVVLDPLTQPGGPEVVYSTGVKLPLLKTIQIDFTRIRRKRYVFMTSDVEYADCGKGRGSFKFKVTLNSFAKPVCSISAIVTGPNGFSYTLPSGSNTSGVYAVLPTGSFLEPGIYTVTGSINSCGIFGTINFTEQVYIGIESSWTDVQNYSLASPNSYSLFTSNQGTNSVARSINVLEPLEIGWVKFGLVIVLTETINNGVGPEFSFITTTSNLAEPTLANTFLRFTRFLVPPDPFGNYGHEVLGVFGNSVGQNTNVISEFDPNNSEILIHFNLTTFSVYKRDPYTVSPVFLFTLPRPTGRIWMKATGLPTELHTYKDVVSSFKCSCEEVTEFSLTSSNGVQIVCAGDLTQLSLVPVNTFGLTASDFNYSWFPNSNISCVDCFNPIVYPPLTTIYTVTITPDAVSTISNEGRGCLPASITITVGECEEEEAQDAVEVIGCVLGNFGAAIYVSEGTELNVYCNVINELGDLNPTTGSLEKGQFVNKSRISTTRDWINNAQNNLFITGEGTSDLMGADQQMRGVSSIYYYNLDLSGTGKKEQLIDEYCLHELDLTDVELATRDNTFHQLYSNALGLYRNNGFISTDNDLGYFERSISPTFTNPFLYPLGSTLGGYRYRPVEVKNLTTTTTVKMHFENEVIPASLDVALKAPNVLSLNNQYYYKIASASVNPDIGITMYYEPSEGTYQAISHWTNSGVASPIDWWGSTPGSTSTSIPSTLQNTLGLVSATTNGIQNFDSDNFTLAKAGFYINTEDFGDQDEDGDGIPDSADTDSTGGTDNDGDGVDDSVDVTYTGGTDSDGNGVDDEEEEDETVITVTSPGGGSTGGGVGDPSFTGEETIYTPTPVAGTYNINVVAGTCGTNGVIEFTINEDGTLDASSIFYHPNGDNSNNYFLAKDLYTIDDDNTGFIIQSTPKSTLAKCVNNVQISMGMGGVGNENFVLTNMESIHFLDPSGMLVGGTFELLDNTNTSIITNSIMFGTPYSLSPLPAPGVYRFKLTITLNGMTEIINGQFIIQY